MPFVTKRKPSQRELWLLHELADGPKLVLAGPVGTCLKRGWIMSAGQQTSPGLAGSVSSRAAPSAWAAAATVALTDEGRRLIAGRTPRKP